MSSDVVNCPQCGTSLQNTPAVAGQVVGCPQCQTQLQMPQIASGTVTPPHLPPTGLQSTPVPDLPTPVPQVSTEVNVAATGESHRPTSSVQDRLHRRSSPVPLIVTMVIVLLLGVIGTVGFLMERAAANRSRLENQMIGNWELADGRSEFDRWEFAFHGTGRMQMKLVDKGVEDMSEGTWKVTHARGNTAYVRIEWPDDAPETMTVRFGSGQIRIELQSGEKFTFRSALPTISES